MFLAILQTKKPSHNKKKTLIIKKKSNNITFLKNICVR